MNRKMYAVTISYDMPVANIGQLPAENEEQARKILAEAHAGMKNFSIIDLYELGEAPQMELPLEIEENNDGLYPIAERKLN